jgi:protein-disulfide isomerase
MPSLPVLSQFEADVEPSTMMRAMNMERTMKSNCAFSLSLWMLLMLTAAIAAMTPAGAQKCPTPDAAKRQQVETYVIARYRLLSAADIKLTDSKQANEICFWQFNYEFSNPKREVAVYLSPDGNYLTPTLYDIRTEPFAEEAAAREQNVKSLLVGTFPELGDKNAPIMIVEFADFQCPYCKRMADTLRKDLLPSEGNNVRFVFRNYPLPMHPWAMAAAEMAECVALQKPSEFWKVHDFLFENQSQLTADNIKDKLTQFIAANVAIDQGQYWSCVDNDLAMGPVKKEMDLGQKLGVRGTPSIFINGAFYSGFKDAPQLRALIEGAQKGDFHAASLPENSAANDNSARRAACPPKAQGALNQ